MATSNDDCFYFYTSTCTKGNNCAYRHCEAARQSTVTCVYWKQNKCNSKECPYRHSERIKPIMQNKAELPCYFETVASGCTRQLCPFKHTKPRPQKALKASGSSANIITLVDATQDESTDQPTPGTLAEPQSLEGPVIDPIIVNPGEDSDFDSPYNSPVKSVVQKSKSCSNIIDVVSRKDLTFQETEKKNDSALLDPVKKVLSPSSHQPSGKTSPLLRTSPGTIKSLSQNRNAISSSLSSKSVVKVKKTSPILPKSNKKIGQLSAKTLKSESRPSTAPHNKQLVKKAGTPQQKRARKALASAKERSKHTVSQTADTDEGDQQAVKKQAVSVEPKVISLKKKPPEKEEEVKTTDEENSDEDLGIKSLEQTLRERALRSMGIIELKSGRIVRTKDQPVKKEEPVKRRKHSTDEERKKIDKSEKNSSEKLSVHKRIGTAKHTPSPGRKRSTEERNSQVRNKEREERIKRLKLEQERENKRRQIMAAKRKARAEKALEAVKKRKTKGELPSEEENSESEEVPEDEESGSEGGSEHVKEEVEEEDLGEEVDIELAEGELEESEEEEDEEEPLKVVVDTRRAIRKSDSVENFTIKKTVPVQPVKAKVVQEVTIKKTFVVEPKEEKEKSKRKRRVILEDDDPAPVPVFPSRSNIRPKEVKEIEDVKKPKLEKTQENMPEPVVKPVIKPVIKPVVKPVVSAPKVKTTNVWSRRAWDSKPKESGDSGNSRPSLGGIRSRLGLSAGTPGGAAGDQETKSSDAEPKIRRRLGWRKTPVVSAEDDTDSDSTTAKKAVSLAAIRTRVGPKPDSDEDLTSVQSEPKTEISAAIKRYRQPVQIYVPPAKKRPSIPDGEEPSKKRFAEENMLGLKDEKKSKEMKTFAQIMAEKRERQKKLVEEQKNTSSSVDGSPSKKTYSPVKFAISESDLADNSTKLGLPGESPLSVSVSNSVLPPRISSTSSSGHLPVSSSFSDSIVTSSNSQSWSFTEKDQTNPSISTPVTRSDNLGNRQPVLDNQYTKMEDNLPQTSTYKVAPAIAVSEISSTQNLDGAGDHSVGVSEHKDQNYSEKLPDDKKESVVSISSNIGQEETIVTPAKRTSHNDSWLDIDIGDLDEDISEDETNDDDLLREIDELLA